MTAAFTLDSVKVLHLEPTTICNASCPQCARVYPELYNPAIHQSSLTLEFLQDVLPETFIAQLDKMFMCGNFGDPAAATDTIKIFQWFRQINPKITLGINTNGSIRSEQWWGKLASIFSHPEDFAVFSIDGLKDTNHIYRVNVQWEKVMRNAAKFISSGGNAHWDMLVFRHNEHQVKEAEELARSMGFRYFRSKVTRRMAAQPVSWLSLPDGYAAPVSNPSKTIDCHALKEASVFIAANGVCLPCCFMGSKIFDDTSPLCKLINMNELDLRKHSLDDVFSKFTAFSNTWADNPFIVCQSTCGVSSSKSAFEQQWRNEIEL